MQLSRVGAAVRGLAGRANRGVVYKSPGVVAIESLPYPKLEVRRCATPCGRRCETAAQLTTSLLFTARPARPARRSCRSRSASASTA